MKFRTKTRTCCNNERDIIIFVNVNGVMSNCCRKKNMSQLVKSRGSDLLNRKTIFNNKILKTIVHIFRLQKYIHMNAYRLHKLIIMVDKRNKI